MINLDRVSEGIHYELIPDDDINEQAWNVRIKEGDFVETVIRFGNISFVGEELHFSFALISSPDENLTEDSHELQDFAALILEDVLEKAATDGSLALREKDDN